MVLADGTIYGMVGRYQVCIVDMSIHVVPADGTIHGTVSQYQGLVVDMNTQVVPADGTILSVVGWYQGYVVYMNIQWYQPMALSLLWSASTKCMYYHEHISGMG